MRGKPSGYAEVDRAAQVLACAVREILRENEFTLYLYGSAALGDWRPGWSDLDILCLCRKPLSESEAQALLELRQKLVCQHENGIFRTFEGGFVTLKGLQSGRRERSVYWGTGGQRMQESYRLDSFGMWEMKTAGILLCGEDRRAEMSLPGRTELVRDVRRHYEVIRKYAQNTDESLYACGWLLDICRCLYTLKTGRVAAKTFAGEWALQNGLCNVPAELEKALRVRKAPLEWKNSAEYRRWAAGLGPTVQRFADVLQRALEREG